MTDKPPPKGQTPLDVWNAMTPEERAPYKAKFGEQTAAYFGVVKPGQPELTPEVRGIMDRMYGGGAPAQPQRPKDKFEARMFDGLQRAKAANPDTPMSVGQINPFPAETFAVLQAGVRSGRFRVYRFSSHYDAALFGFMATPGRKFVGTLGMWVMLASPFISVALGFFYSWWWLLAVLALFPLGFTMQRNSYNRAMLQAAVRSERAFCILYHVKQVAVSDRQARKEYWRKP